MSHMRAATTKTATRAIAASSQSAPSLRAMDNGLTRAQAAGVISTLAFYVLMSVLACAQVTAKSHVTRPVAASVGGSSAEMEKGMMVRISEIDIHAEALDEYKAILKEEAEESVRLEPGVISIFPMYQKVNPTAVRILEIYASRAAYESHLKSPHFLKYRTTTLKMVRSLSLVDMEVMDAATMALMFKKMSGDAP
jgi:quinol monooxygenase YgiN